MRAPALTPAPYLLAPSLGTPPEHKRRVVYETSHMIPRNETIKEVVNWMEKYWGEPSR